MSAATARPILVRTARGGAYIVEADRGGVIFTLSFGAEVFRLSRGETAPFWAPVEPSEAETSDEDDAPTILPLSAGYSYVTRLPTPFPPLRVGQVRGR